MAKKSFFQGALILTIAGICGKILSAGYRVPFNRMVGPEGAGIYSMSYSIYSIIFALSTAGIPLAVSKMVAVTEERKLKGESIRIVRVSSVLLAVIGCFVAIIFFLSAPWIATHYFEEPRVIPSLQALAPAMLFSCLMAVFRGFFQGQQNMVPTAVSQILEQFFRVGTILLSLFVLLNKPLQWVVAGASFGSMVGGLCGFLFLLIVFLRYQKKHQPQNDQSDTYVDSLSDREIIKQLLYYAIPISIGALMLPIMQFIDSSLVTRRLEMAGFEHEIAISQLGYISNYAMPIINLPFIVTTAIAASLVPAVANAFELKDANGINGNVRAAMMLTMILTLPASAGLYFLATPISVLLYNDADAGPVLAALAFTVLVVGLYQATSGALQGLGHVLIPMASLLIGASAKIALTWILPTLPTLNIKGAALATVISFGLAALHNILQLARCIGWQWFDWMQTVLKPILATTIMVASVEGLLLIGSKLLFSEVLILPFAIILGGLTYFVVLYFIGGIEREALLKIPKVGAKLAARFAK